MPCKMISIRAGPPFARIDTSETYVNVNLSYLLPEPLHGADICVWRFSLPNSCKELVHSSEVLILHHVRVSFALIYNLIICLDATYEG